VKPVVFHDSAGETILRSIDKDHPDDSASLHSRENVRYENGDVEPAGVKAPAMTAFHAPNAVGDPPHDRHIHAQFDYVQNNQECVPADESSCSLLKLLLLQLLLLVFDEIVIGHLILRQNVKIPSSKVLHFVKDKTDNVKTEEEAIIDQHHGWVEE